MAKKRKKVSPFPPTDPTKFWVAPHCGPGHMNEDQLCECGMPMRQCAVKNGLQSAETGIQWCGCVGLVCPNCKRMWANDVCMERYDTELICVDGTYLEYERARLKCPCGQLLSYQETIGCVCVWQLFMVDTGEVILEGETTQELIAKLANIPISLRKVAIRSEVIGVLLFNEEDQSFISTEEETGW